MTREFSTPNSKTVLGLFTEAVLDSGDRSPDFRDHKPRLPKPGRVQRVTGGRLVSAPAGKPGPRRGPREAEPSPRAAQPGPRAARAPRRLASRDSAGARGLSARACARPRVRPSAPLPTQRLVQVPGRRGAPGLWVARGALWRPGWRRPERWWPRPGSPN